MTPHPQQEKMYLVTESELKILSYWDSNDIELERAARAIRSRPAPMTLHNQQEYKCVQKNPCSEKVGSFHCFHYPTYKSNTPCPMLRPFSSPPAAPEEGYRDCNFWKIRACKSMTTNNCWNRGCPDHDEYQRQHDAAIRNQTLDNVMEATKKINFNCFCPFKNGGDSCDQYSFEACLICHVKHITEALRQNNTAYSEPNKDTVTMPRWVFDWLLNPPKTIEERGSHTNTEIHEIIWSLKNNSEVKK